MAADYDLVILGSSATAERLALAAKAYSARVAWITFPEIISDWHIQQLWHPNPDWQWQLANRGIDVLAQSAQFVAPNAVQVEKRILTARHFVVCHPPQANWHQLVQGWTWQEFYDLHHTLTEIAIAGNDALCVAIAQWLNQQGIQVSLLLPNASIFPQLDREAARFLQAQLEGQGIKVFTGHRVTATKQVDAGQAVAVWAGDRHFSVSNLLLPRFISVVPQLALDLVPRSRLHYLTNRHDIDSILQKVVFAGWFRRKASPIITCYHTQPAIAQVGSMSHPPTRQKLVLRSVSAQHFAKIITTPSGQILSACMVGQSAVFWIEAIAQAMQSARTLKTLSASDPISYDLRSQFERQQSYPWQELWLNICRDFNL